MLNCVRLTKARRMILCFKRTAVICAYTFVVLEAEIFDCGIKTLQYFAGWLLRQVSLVVEFTEVLSGISDRLQGVGGKGH